MRPNVLLVTAANDAYQAATAVARPTPAARLDDVRVRAGVADAQQEERHRQQDEDERDRRGGPQRGDEHVRREDAPRDEEQADGVTGVGRRDALLEELHEGPEREPEGAVGREGHRAEGVAGAELPHAGQELREAAVGQGEAEDDRLATGADELGVEHAEHERRQREPGEAQRAGIRDRAGDELTRPAAAPPAGSKRRSDWRFRFHEIPSRLEVLTSCSPVTIAPTVRYRHWPTKGHRSGAALALLLLRCAVLVAGGGGIGAARARGGGRRRLRRAAPARARSIGLAPRARRVRALAQLLLGRPRLGLPGDPCLGDAVGQRPRNSAPMAASQNTRMMPCESSGSIARRRRRR